MREVELYRTADEKKKERLLDLLMKERISYLEKQEKIPIFRRKENNAVRSYISSVWMKCRRILQMLF